MAQKLAAGMPAALDLGASYIVQVAALDPASGAAVSGVNVSNVSIFATPTTVTGEPTTMQGIPLWVPVPNLIERS